MCSSCWRTPAESTTTASAGRMYRNLISVIFTMCSLGRPRSTAPSSGKATQAPCTECQLSKHGGMYRRAMIRRTSRRKLGRGRRRDTCLTDAFRSLGLKVPYDADGPFYAIQDGRRILSSIGHLDRTITCTWKDMFALSSSSALQLLQVHHRCSGGL